MTLRVGTYNLNGRVGDDTRLHRQLRMLAILRLDVLGLQECKEWGQGELETAGRVLGMRGVLSKSNHHGCHLVTFVREPAVQVVEEHHDQAPPWWHCLCYVVANVHGQTMNLANVHLAPASPATRLAEAESLQLLAKKDTPTILFGDMNAAPAAGEDPPLPPEVNEEHARRKLDRGAARAIVNVGLIDVGAAAGNHAPTVGYRREDRLAYPCDRIHTNLPPETITGFEVVTYDTASDHRPVFATFDLG